MKILLASIAIATVMNFTTDAANTSCSSDSCVADNLLSNSDAASSDHLLISSDTDFLAADTTTKPPSDDIKEASDVNVTQVLTPDATVPEPMTIALTGLGLVGIGLFRRRGKRN